MPALSVCAAAASIIAIDPEYMPAFLTDRFMVAGPEEGCPQQYCIPINKAERLSEGFWARLKGWPRRGTERQTRFVEGFVRGAVGGG